MEGRLSLWTVRVVLVGLFMIVVHFGRFVYSATWPVLSPLFK
jgi:hypothetical protein